MQMSSDQALDFCGDVLELLGGWDVGDADLVEYDVDAAGFHLVLDEADALAAPAIGAEGEALFLLGLEAFQIGQETGDGRHHLVVDRRRPDGDVFGRQDVGDDIGHVVLLYIVVVCRDAGALEGLGDAAGHGLRRVPHAVEDDDGTLLGHSGRPFLVAVHDRGDVLAPDDAVAGGNHPDIEPAERLEGLLGLRPVEHEDVGVVFLRLEQDDRQIVLIVEAVARGIVLAERVVREQDLLLRAVGDHAVRPVQHRGGYELQRALADRQRLARLDCLIVQLAIAGREALETLRRAGDDCGVGADLGHERDAAGMIGLDMARYDVVDFRRIDDALDALEQLRLEAVLHRIDERDFVIEDEVGVIRRAAAGLIAVERAHRPVDGSYPVYIFRDFYCFHS